MARISRFRAAGRSADSSLESGLPIEADQSANSSGAPQAEGYRLRSNGRFVSNAERIAAARARVTADTKRHVTTEAWIVDLARQAG